MSFREGNPAEVIQGLAIPTVLFFILRRLNKRSGTAQRFFVGLSLGLVKGRVFFFRGFITWDPFKGNLNNAKL